LNKYFWIDDKKVIIFALNNGMTTFFRPKPDGLSTYIVLNNNTVNEIQYTSF